MNEIDYECEWKHDVTRVPYQLVGHEHGLSRMNQWFVRNRACCGLLFRSPGTILAKPLVDGLFAIGLKDEYENNENVNFF